MQNFPHPTDNWLMTSDGLISGEIDIAVVQRSFRAAMNLSYAI
jgi:hypothetical protein